MMFIHFRTGSRWVDADSIVVNPALPVEIFHPPHDFEDVHLLATKDHNGLNSGVFSIPVDEWSVRMMAKALALPMFRPDINLGFSADQVAMELVLNETEIGRHVLYQPRIWYNTYEFHHGYEGEKGDFLVHFPRLEDDRWQHMTKWLDTVEGSEARQWEMGLAQTRYPAQIDRYWTLVRQGEDTLKLAEDYIKYHEHVQANVAVAFNYLYDVMRFQTDQTQAMRSAVTAIRLAMDLDNMGVKVPDRRTSYG